MVNVLHLYLIAHNWQQQATQAPACAALFPASSPVQGWMLRQLDEGRALFAAPTPVAQGQP